MSEHKTPDELRQMVVEALMKVPFPSMWVHNASGKQYFVALPPVFREEDLQLLVVYRGSMEPYFWTRPIDEFLSKFTRKRIEEPFNAF